MTKRFFCVLAAGLALASCPAVFGQAPKVLYSWSNLGIPPGEPLVLAGDGNYYGTAESGDSNDDYSIVRVTPSGVVTAIYTVNYLSGVPYAPIGGLVVGNDGNLYGVMSQGGSGNNGAYFRMSLSGVYTNLSYFTNAMGKSPAVGLALGSDGNFYGITNSGGANNLGTIFSATPSGVMTPVYSFTSADGYPATPLVNARDGSLYGRTVGGFFRYTPGSGYLRLHAFTLAEGNSGFGALVQGADNQLYGTTYSGGSNSVGTVYKITTAGVVTVLQNLSNTLGATPYVGLCAGSDGNFYGVTTAGGSSGNGVLFRVSSTGGYTVIHNFTGADGSNSRSPVVQTTDGLIVGVSTTQSGYTPIYRLALDGTMSVIGHFDTSNGISPQGALTQGPDGNFYGATSLGGAATIYRMTPQGAQTLLYSFNPTSGNSPGPVVFGADGNLYGATQFGGAHNSGMLYSLTMQGVFSTIYDFDSTHAFPLGGLVRANDGNFYGTTSSGAGSLFRLTPAGAVTFLATFTSATGMNPQNSLVTDGAGNLYGTTYSGATNGFGTVFKSTLGGTITVSHNFNGSDGEDIASNLWRRTDGALFGSTNAGGIGGAGVAFEISPTGNFSVLAQMNSLRAETPAGPPVQAIDGNLYGFAQADLTSNGLIYKITPAGVASVFYTFSGPDGSTPQAQLISAADGNLYGTTAFGGPGGGGVFFRIAMPTTLSPVTLSSSNPNATYAEVGDTLTLHFTSNKPIQPPVVTIAGVTAAPTNVGGNNWTASIVVTKALAQNSVPISVVVTDLAGDVSAPVTVTTDQSHVSIDYTPPTFSGVAITSTNSNPLLATIGDTITLSFTTSEAVQTPLAAIDGQAASVTNLGGNTWSATTTVAAGFPQGAAYFSISATDFAGNTSQPKMTTTNGSSVTVDFTPPAVFPVTFASSNANSRYAKIGDTITLGFTTDEVIQTPVATIASQPASVTNPSGNHWLASVVVTNAFPAGPAPFSIMTTDLAGNAGRPVTATTDGSSVTIELTAPLITPVSIASSNANAGYAKVGDFVTVTFITNEVIQTPSVTISGQTAPVANPTGNTWTAAVAVTDAFPQGIAAFSVSAIDLAGNAAPVVTSVTDSSAVIIDTVAPAVDLSGIPLRGYEAGQELPDLRALIVATDTNSPVTLIQAPAAGAPLTTGPLDVTFTATDPAGNSTQSLVTLSISPADPTDTDAASRGGRVTGQALITHYGALGTPEIGAFDGKIISGHRKAPATYAADGSVLLEVGASAPGLDGTSIAKLGQPSGDAVLATLAPGAGGIGRDNSVVLITGLATGSPIVVAQTDTPNHGLPSGVTIKSFGTIDGDGRDTFFLATLKGPGVHAGNARALCAITGGEVNILVRHGDPVNGKNVSVIGTLVGSAGTLADSRWRVNDTTIGVRLTFSDESEALYTIPATAVQASDWTLQLKTGTSAIPTLANANIKKFGLPGFGPDGFAVVAHLALGSGGVRSADDDAVISGSGGGAPVVVARKGDTVADDANGNPLVGVTIAEFSNPIMGGAGAVAYRFRVQGHVIHPEKKEWIAFTPDGQHPRVLANAGAVAPGGGIWRNFRSLVLPKGVATGPIFDGTLAVHAFDEVSRKSDFGLWGVDVTGSLRLLLRTGQSVDVNGKNKRLHAFRSLQPAAGSVGAASGYDSDGDTAVLATFTDRSEALIDVTQP